MIKSSAISPRIRTHPFDYHGISSRSAEGMTASELHGDVLLTIPTGQCTQPLLFEIAVADQAYAASGRPRVRNRDRFIGVLIQGRPAPANSPDASK